MNAEDNLPQAAYERKYSVFQRLYKIIISPSEAMKDIALAPDYGGPLFVVILRMVVAVVAISILFQKFQLVGDSQIVSEVWGIISLILSIAVIISIFLYVAFWLLKSLLVKYLCNSWTDWSFGAAASVTG